VLSFLSRQILIREPVSYCPCLLDVCELADAGAKFLITGYRDTNTNLRTQLLRIIRRAGLSPWPKLFHNLRATRETELAAQYPMHVVCSWIGNSAGIAAKHYLQVTDADFARGAALAAPGQEGDAECDAAALQKALQQVAALFGTDGQGLSDLLERCGVVPNSATWRKSLQDRAMPLVGAEPIDATAKLTKPLRRTARTRAARSEAIPKPLR
jgi:hypothetical protein